MRKIKKCLPLFMLFFICGLMINNIEATKANNVPTSNQSPVTEVDNKGRIISEKTYYSNFILKTSKMYIYQNDYNRDLKEYRESKYNGLAIEIYKHTKVYYNNSKVVKSEYKDTKSNSSIILKSSLVTKYSSGKLMANINKTFFNNSILNIENTKYYYSSGNLKKHINKINRSSDIYAKYSVKNYYDYKKLANYAVRTKYSNSITQYYIKASYNTKGIRTKYNRVDYYSNSLLKSKYAIIGNQKSNKKALKKYVNKKLSYYVYIQTKNNKKISMKKHYYSNGKLKKKKTYKYNIKGKLLKVYTKKYK